MANIVRSFTMPEGCLKTDIYIFTVQKKIFCLFIPLHTPKPFNQ